MKKNEKVWEIVTEGKINVGIQEKIYEERKE